jgi:putative ABC transport system permease protein
VSDLPAATYNAKLVSAQPGVFDLHRLKVAQGRRLLGSDDTYQRRVAVLGSELAEQAFGSRALGKRIRIGYAYFEVVGVLAPKGSGGDLPIDPALYNRAVVIPFETAIAEVTAADTYKEIDIMSIEVESLELTLDAKRALGPVLKSLHGGIEDYEIVAPEEILEKKRSTQAILNVVLICIAAISLLVGGIGVMNIMLANIMERIGEIGLRRAIGASKADIRNQFLTEAVIICFVGGLFGVVLGFGISIAVGSIFHLSVAFAWEAMFVSFGLSLVTGLVFGSWPAMRAAAINPVEALLHQ